MDGKRCWRIAWKATHLYHMSICNSCSNMLQWIDVGYRKPHGHKCTTNHEPKVRLRSLNCSVTLFLFFCARIKTCPLGLKKIFESFQQENGWNICTINWRLHDHVCLRMIIIELRTFHVYQVRVCVHLSTFTTPWRSDRALNSLVIYLSYTNNLWFGNITRWLRLQSTFLFFDGQEPVTKSYTGW